MVLVLIHDFQIGALIGKKNYKQVLVLEFYFKVESVLKKYFILLTKTNRPNRKIISEFYVCGFKVELMQMLIWHTWKEKILYRNGSGHGSGQA